MYFYLYNVENFNKDSVVIYGREIVGFDGSVDNIKKCNTIIKKFTVKNVVSPVLFICKEEDGFTLQNLEKDVDEFFNNENCAITKEINLMKNIFYKEMNDSLHVVKVIPRTNIDLGSFSSKNCEKIIHQFSSPLENILISRKIKGPCIIKIDTTSFLEKKNNIFLDSLDKIEFFAHSTFPNLNYASLCLITEANKLIGFSTCIGNKKTVNGEIKGFKKKELMLLSQENVGGVISTYLSFENEKSMISHVEKLYEDENIDCIIVFNVHRNILHKFNLRRFIVCDFYIYATGNIKCKSYTLLEIAKIFKYSKISAKSNLVNQSIALYNIFLLSDSLLLSKEVSEISGYLLNKVLNNNRAEIIEYTLLHELYDRKHLFPPISKHDEQKYVGGLVLNPEIGAYDTLVLLLDYNSLYPSIIQEYNVCFSTVDNLGNTEKKDFSEKGFLPKILQNLVQRRKAVKSLICKNNEEAKMYDFRQKALKLTANSIYGCLGSQISRFCNYKMASFITNKGRELLLEAKNAAEDLGYKVIYGDTDSIMIDTKLSYKDINIAKALEIASNIKRNVNVKYKHVELEFEKIFIKLLLYTKKKYAGLVLDDTRSVKEEIKGLDTIRRDFCKASTEIVNKILSILLTINEDDNDEKLKNDIYRVLIDEASKLRERPKEDFVINTILSKPLDKYNTEVPLPHIFLGRRLKDDGMIFNQGDVIPFIIGVGEDAIHKRAFHLSEDKEIDYSYYISNQIMPSLSRILSVVKVINIEKIQKIFGIKGVQKIIPVRQMTFLTPCCDSVQFPLPECTKCGKLIKEEFYLRKVQDMVRKEIDLLYSTKLYCTECNYNFNDFYKFCVFCNNKLTFKANNVDFDNFLDNLVKSFETSEFSSVLSYLKMVLKHSAFRYFDLSPYFQMEIENYLKGLDY